MNAIVQTKTAFQNALDRQASRIVKLTRAVNAEYVGLPATEISTNVSGTIKELTYEPSVWNRQTQSFGCWNVVVTVAGYGEMNLPPYALKVGSE